MQRFIQFLMTNLCVLGVANAVQDPLPSWYEGSIKKNLIEFVKEVTLENGSNYVAPKDRVATFDEDGTLWVEQPLYTEYTFALDSIKALAPKHPDWNNIQPFKSIISGDAEAIKNFDAHNIEELIAVTHSGMSVDDFHDRVSHWLKKAVHPRFKRPYTELVYQPMLEVIQFLRDNHFQIYIVSGGGQEFMRPYTEQLYGIPPENVIGTAGHVKYDYQNGHPVLMKQPKVLFVDDKAGKPEGINLMIGKRPIAAFGNSIGDQQMLEWTQANQGKTFELLVHHDDAEREYSYGPESKIGTFSDALMQEAKKRDWNVVSMKNDWKIIFPGE